MNCLTFYRYDEGGSLVGVFGFQGFEVSISGPNEGRFPFFPGPVYRFKVYDPEERVDCDNDTRAWRFSIESAQIQLFGSVIAIEGFTEARPYGPFAPTCEQGHQPWEHDGVCDGYTSLIEIAPRTPVKVMVYHAEVTEPEFKAYVPEEVT